MKVFELQSEETNQTTELEALLDAIYGGDKLPSSEQWMTDLFYDQIDEVSSDDTLLICINEGYFADWHFNDKYLVEATDKELETITDTDRLAYARDCLRGFRDSDAIDDAPLILFLRLYGRNKRRAHLILGALPAGQAGLYITLVHAFLDGDYETELLDCGWLNIELLEEVNDDWILNLWFRS